MYHGKFDVNYVASTDIKHATLTRGQTINDKCLLFKDETSQKVNKNVSIELQFNCCSPEIIFMAYRVNEKMFNYNFFFLAFLATAVNFDGIECTVEGMGNFPQFLSDSKNCRYLSVKVGHKRNRFGKVKEIRVENQLECSRYCTKMADSCVAVNVETKSVNGRHLCEIYNQKSLNEDRDLASNALFNYISLEVKS